MSPHDEIARLRRVAEVLETWAESLPRQGKDSQEPWYAFLDRRYEAETRIIEQIRHTPNCHISICFRRRSVHLEVAGVSIRTSRGLEAALRGWVGNVRRRIG